MIEIEDQLGRKIKVKRKPTRIISLVPSQTELLAALGLEKEVVGITRFCVHPDSWFQEKTRVGGTKDLKFNVIRDLNPDLIIANKEENTRDQIETLAKEYPVWISNVNDLSSAKEMIRHFGEINGKQKRASEIIAGVETNFSKLPIPTNKLPRVAYLIWRKPYMVAAGDTFIDKMLEMAGFENYFRSQKRYPEVYLKEMENDPPDFFFLSSEPYPFKEKHFSEFLQYCPDAGVELVDGEFFSWYGSRLVDAPSYFLELRKKLKID
ncbi:MAG: ABC transporter substrate-binding protein [Saprospiraceae bacterium]|nr:ABC transporter substrate-binding protein [Saprospiraceae bacterium]